MGACTPRRAGDVRGLPVQSVLLQVVAERDPTLRTHVCDVGLLAVAVGRRLGLDPEELDELGRAASLHDIGKLAIPEAILCKPAPLSESEQLFHRPHDHGERILNVAPALRVVARLVRSTHERWDGGGYADGLARAEHPAGPESSRYVTRTTRWSGRSSYRALALAGGRDRGAAAQRRRPVRPGCRRGLVRATGGAAAAGSGSQRAGRRA